MLCVCVLHVHACVRDMHTCFSFACSLIPPLLIPNFPFPLPFLPSCLPSPHPQLEQSFQMQVNMGIAGEGESDEVKRIFLEGNPYLLALTMVGGAHDTIRGPPIGTQIPRHCDALPSLNTLLMHLVLLLVEPLC